MEKKVTKCNECYFAKYDNEDGNYYCEHPEGKDVFWIENRKILHPSCPEGQPFVIITSKMKEDESK